MQRKRSHFSSGNPPGRDRGSGREPSEVPSRYTGLAPHRFSPASVWRTPAIEEAALTAMFDPLTRGAEAQSEDNAGGSLGLGLFIAREIVKAHRGDIDVRSDEKETVFSVRVPRRP